MLFFSFFFFFNDTATTEIYTLSHTTLFRSLVSKVSALIRIHRWPRINADKRGWSGGQPSGLARGSSQSDRKSTRLNSSHMSISYAVFCLKKKKKKKIDNGEKSNESERNQR